MCGAPDGTLLSSTGGLLCASSSPPSFASTCASPLTLSSNGGLNAPQGCLGVAGGGGTVSSLLGATLSLSPDHCPPSSSASTWSLWADEYAPPGILWQVRADPSVGLAGVSWRWGIPLVASSTPCFRGGLGDGGGALRATNAVGGGSVDFAGGYVEHAAWGCSGSSTLFLRPTGNSKDAYTQEGDALLVAWKAAFPSSSTPHSVLLGPSLAANACDHSLPTYSGYSANGGYCKAGPNVDTGNELQISLHSGLSFVFDPSDEALVRQLSARGQPLASHLMLTATDSSGALHRLVPDESGESNAHTIRSVRRGRTASHLLASVGWRKAHSGTHGDVCRAASGSWHAPYGCETAGGRWVAPPYAAIACDPCDSPVPCDHTKLRRSAPPEDSNHLNGCGHLPEEACTESSSHTRKLQGSVAEGSLLELIVWADCISLHLTSLRSTGALGGPLSLTRVDINWTIAGVSHLSPPPAADGSVSLRVCLNYDSPGCVVGAVGGVKGWPAKIRERKMRDFGMVVGKGGEMWGVVERGGELRGEARRRREEWCEVRAVIPVAASEDRWLEGAVAAPSAAYE
ncbi:MAG: hypothetical protein SGPRY_010292, partial [Prymnesium sp.]